jgi:hypothetical protein
MATPVQALIAFAVQLYVRFYRDLLPCSIYQGFLLAESGDVRSAKIAHFASLSVSQSAVLTCS